MGLDVRNQLIVQRDRWEEYMSAFRTYYEGKGHVNALFTHPILGTLLHHIRTGNTQVPPQFEEELWSMGLDVRNQKIVQRDGRWEEYMSVFREYYEEKGHVNAPLRTRSSERCSIASGAATLKCRPSSRGLRSMGLDVRNQKIVQRDARWEEYMSAFREYYEERATSTLLYAPDPRNAAQ